VIDNPLTVKNVELKIKSSKMLLEDFDFFKDVFNKDREACIKGEDLKFIVPLKPFRDVEVKKASELPKRKGLSYLEGKKRLIHDLASIELQAMELGFRTLFEFYNKPDIPEDFFKELLRITYEETLHLELCIDTLKEYGGLWGEFPVHLGLWNVSKKTDSLLERLLKVHRYLEGSGLDASFSLLSKVKTLNEAKPLVKLISRIAHDEISHVAFGSKWFVKFCEEKGLDRASECRRILRQEKYCLPRRKERINELLRLDAGFTKEEIFIFLEEQKTNFTKPDGSLSLKKRVY